MTKEVEILQEELRFIDSRLSAIEPIVGRLRPGDYQRQELQSEASTLAAHRRMTDQKLRELTGNNPDHERVLRNAERVEKLRAARVQSYRTQCEETAQEFERQGDFRNASMWRLQALQARLVAENEIR